jgi:hypothetical protein
VYEIIVAMNRPKACTDIRSFHGIPMNNINQLALNSKDFPSQVHGALYKNHQNLIFFQGSVCVGFGKRNGPIFCDLRFQFMAFA